MFDEFVLAAGINDAVGNDERETLSNLAADEDDYDVVPSVHKADEEVVIPDNLQTSYGRSL